jgi:hypothetical protein
VPKIFGIERHLLFAIVFFVSLAVMTLVFFPKGKISLAKNQEKKRRKKKEILCIKPVGGSWLAAWLFWFFILR